MVLLLLVLACAVWCGEGANKCVYVCMPMFGPGRYSDEHILKFFKDKLTSMPCQNQVSKERVSSVSHWTSINGHVAFCRGSSSMAFPRHMNKPKNCLHVRYLQPSLPTMCACVY